MVCGVLQREASQDVVYYVSPQLRRLGVPHAFSTRCGGVSQPPFESLNLGNPSGCEIRDDSECIRENYRRLQCAIGCQDLPRRWVHQVHGNRVERVRRGEPFISGVQADALVGDDPQQILAVRVADCVPILLSSGDGRRVAAVHAGWRGVVGDVVGAAIAALGDEPQSMVAAIGPCIGFDAFEVGPEVLQRFRHAFDGQAPVREAANGKGFVDLRHAVRLQLLRHGLREDRIDTTDRCTFRDADEFFSHRRDNGVTGRLAALVAAVGS